MTEALKFYGGKESPPLNKKKKCPLCCMIVCKVLTLLALLSIIETFKGILGIGASWLKASFIKEKKYVIKTCMQVSFLS